MRLLGAILILLACVGAGQRGAGRLADHCALLLGAEQGVLTLSREIGFRAAPLSQALPVAAEAAGAAGELFRRAGDKLAAGEGWGGGEAWRQALAELNPAWNPAEAAALAAIGAGLGDNDLAGQVRQLELARLRLADCQQQAAERCACYGRIWRSMGWAAGAVLVLFLL